LDDLEEGEVRVLDLFAGKKGASAAFVDRGHEVVTLDISEHFGCTLTSDILCCDADSLNTYGPFDFIWASPPCEAFSVASMGHHWKGGDCAYKPATEHAVVSQEIVAHTIRLIAALSPRAWVMENPRGVLRKLRCVAGIPQVEVCYCRYGHRAMKPTDLWGRLPDGWLPRPMCHNGHPDHEAAPRGSKTGTQGLGNAADRAVVPYDLSLSLCKAMERQLLDAGYTWEVHRCGEES
jgi:hypothetical protein